MSIYIVNEIRSLLSFFHLNTRIETDDGITSKSMLNLSVDPLISTILNSYPSCLPVELVSEIWKVDWLDLFVVALSLNMQGRRRSTKRDSQVYNKSWYTVHLGVVIHHHPQSTLSTHNHNPILNRCNSTIGGSIITDHWLYNLYIAWRHACWTWVHERIFVSVAALTLSCTTFSSPHNSKLIMRSRDSNSPDITHNSRVHEQILPRGVSLGHAFKLHICCPNHVLQPLINDNELITHNS